MQDLAIVGHLAALKRGAETNWAIYRMLNTTADEVRAGRYQSRDQPVTLAKAAYNKITGADLAPPEGREEYLAAEKLYQASDFAGSLAMFKRSADKGYPHAACMVAIQYSDGLGTKEDPGRRRRVVQERTSRARRDGRELPGVDDARRRRRPKDPAEGMRLLKLAAEQDNDPAILNIGRAYLFGLGVPKDPDAGLRWYARAAEMGNEQAAYFVKWLGQSPGNRSFKDERQSSAYQRIMILRANAPHCRRGRLALRRFGRRWRAPNPQLAAELNRQADELARENGLE